MGLVFNVFTSNLDITGASAATTWKNPVANAAALPLIGNSDGDSRVTLDTDSIWVWDNTGSRWEHQQLQEVPVANSANANGYSIVVNETIPNLRTLDLTLQPASSAYPGIVSSGTQSFSGNKTFIHDVTVDGDFTVNGTSTTINTATLDVTDANITINNGGTQATADANSSGLTVEMSDATDALIGYDSLLASKWKVGVVGDEYEIVTVFHAQTIINKTIAAGSNTISGLTHGTEVDDPSSGVHGVVGSVVGTTDAQTLTNKTIDSDLNTITNIVGADIKIGAAIDAAKIHDGSVSNAEFGYLDGVTSAIQTQINTKVAGPASATDEAIARYDATTGKLVQDSLITIDDSGVMSGATQLNVDNVRLDGNTVSATSGDLILSGVNIDANTQKIINLVDPTADQDAATKKYVDDNTSSNPGDLDPVSFSLADGQATFADVTGVLFSNGVTRSAEVQYSITIDATADLFESGKLRIVQRGADWVVSRVTNADDALVDFDMTAGGQLQYKSGTYAGFVSGTIKCRALTTSI